MSRETENVDVAFDMILDAANEYSGFVLGIPESDVITAILGGEGEVRDEDRGGVETTRKIRDIISKIIDRTNGCMTLSNIPKELSREFNDANAISQPDLINIVHAGTSQSGQFSIPKAFCLAGTPLSGSELEEDYNDFKEGEIRHIVRYIDPKKFSKRDVLPASTNSEGTDSQGESVRTVTVPEVSPENVALSVGAPASLNQTDTLRVSSPNLGAVVIKDPRFSFSSKNASHMPVFLSAITPLEMSRCVPYLDVKVITNQPTKYNKMGIYNFIRVTEAETSNSSTAFFNPHPVDLDPIDTEDESFFNYMDLFTSPQTMVNADLNKNWFNERNFKNFGNSLSSLFDKDKEDSRTSKDFSFSGVTDPLQPFMSLLGFDVNISGKGFGLLATKKASLRIKLHDKSRIKDIANFLSADRFANTKFVVEFGWSHPDGNVTSNNTLGKYLNALRDTSVYGLQGADYNFGEDNSVSINLKLVCSGFTKMQTVSAAGGRMTNISTVSSEIEEILKLLVGDDITTITEVRSKLRLASSDFSRVGALGDFNKISDFKNAADLYKNLIILEQKRSLSAGFLPDSSADFSKTVLEKVLKIIYNFEEEANLEEIIKQISSGEVNKSRKSLDETLINSGDILYSKLNSLPYGIDPFRAQVSTNYIEHLKKTIEVDSELRTSTIKINDAPLIGVATSEKNSYNQNSDFVSLGKVITSFIGYPMSTSLLYSEVQIMFYPVNSQAAAASKHTTASFPISISALEEEMNKRVLQSENTFRDISVQQFFTMIDAVVSNQQSAAYGLYPENINDLSLVAQFEKKNLDEQYAEASESEGIDIQAIIDQVDLSIEQLERDDPNYKPDVAKVEEVKKKRVVDVYRELLREKEAGTKQVILNKIYDIESPLNGNQIVKQKYLDRDVFKPVRLSMYFETVPARSTKKERDLSEVTQSVVNFYKNQANRRDVTTKGLDLKNSILRIHIYDEEATMNPDLSSYGSGLTNTNGVITSPTIQNLSSYSFVKDMLMSHHPTIIHGAASGVVNSISVSSNTSGDFSRVFLVESYAQNASRESENDEGDDGFDETVMLPSTLSLEIMGFPMLARGQQIFIDFGTQTSLDNLYQIKTVDHTIADGKFISKATLTATNQMIVTSFRNRLKSLANKVIENS